MHTQAQVEQVAAKFAEILREELTDAQWAKMRAKNATGPYQGDCCASHDYCDANMPMEAAFKACAIELWDRDDNMRDEAVALWNAAWDHAKRQYLTAKDAA